MNAAGPNNKGRFLRSTSHLSFCLLLVCGLYHASATTSLTGLLDPSFVSPQFDSNAITSSFLLEEQSTLLQKDGKIIIHGSFTQVGDVNRYGLARLNVDGSVDASFNAGSAPTYQIFAMALQPDGKVILGGSFVSFNGQPAVRLVRLNPDGSRDTSFNVGSGPTFGNIGDYAPVFALAVQPDGRIIIGGDFGLVNGMAANGVARLMTNGALDTTFDTSKVSLRWVSVCAVQADGKILVGNINGLQRFNADGSIDPDFKAANRPSSGVDSILVLPDGRILAAGLFALQGNLWSSILIRLLPDGSADSSFTPFGYGRKGFILTDEQQRILLAPIPISTDDAFGLVRLTPDGTLDGSFELTTGLDYPLVRSAAVQSNGKILIAGIFTNIDGVPRVSIARLNETNHTSVLFFGSTNWIVSETGTNAQIEVVRHGNTMNTATVDYFTQNGTAVTGTQFVGESGTLSFAPGEGSKEIRIPLIADHLPGRASTEFDVVLTNVGGDAVLNNAYARATVSITEADQTVELGSTNYSVNEFGPSIGVTVRRNGPCVFTGDLLVDYTTSDLTAKAGNDYQAVSGTLTFVGYDIDRPGPFELQVAIPIFNKTVFYGDKFFSFSLSNARFANSTGGTVLLGTNKSAVITINGGVELEAMRPDANGRIQLISSATLAGGLVVQASTNLTDWVPIFTNGPSAVLDFYDAQASAFMHRFYRVELSP